MLQKSSQLENTVRERNQEFPMDSDPVAGFSELESELAASKLLTDELREKNDMEKQERELIEQRLTEALEKLSLIESGLADPSSIEDKGLL